MRQLAATQNIHLHIRPRGVMATKDGVEVQLINWIEEWDGLHSDAWKLNTGSQFVDEMSREICPAYPAYAPAVDSEMALAMAIASSVNQPYRQAKRRGMLNFLIQSVQYKTDRQ